MASDSLSSLHTALIDAREGYAKAIEKTHDADALRYFKLLDALHSDAHTDIHGLMAARGEKLDESGSVMGTVHKAVVSVRSAIVGLDEGSLAAFASGEDNNLEAYDAAIRDETDPAGRETLTKHREALAEKVAEMKLLAERA